MKKNKETGVVTNIGDSATAAALREDYGLYNRSTKHVFDKIVKKFEEKSFIIVSLVPLKISLL